MPDEFDNSQRFDPEAQQNQDELDEEVDTFDEDEFEELEDMNVGITPDIKGKQLIYVSDEGIAFKASDYLEITKVTKNLDTKKVKLTLHHISECFDKELDIELQNLKKTELFKKLTSNGVMIHEMVTGQIATYLMEQVDVFFKTLNVQYEHENVGWNDISDISQGFFAAESIGSQYQSTIRGNDDKVFGTNGDRAVYEKMIREQVLPNQLMQLPFVLAFTAPLIPLMYDKSACPVLLTNFAGKSSHGKTTALTLMASVWGRGIVANSRLSVIKSFASTQNGFEASVNGNYGVPVLFDDYETAPDNVGFGKLIYTLAQGESKIRCDKFGHATETYQWRTSIALSGESSIFERAGKNRGLKPRIVEFRNKSWTSSKSNSIKITSTVSTNYGFYGPEFVNGLLKISKNELDALYDASEKAIESMLPSKDNIADRIQTRLTLIRMTAELVRKILDINIDVDFITKFLVENEEARQTSSSDSEEAKELVAEYINSNLTRFVRTEKRLDGTTLPSNTMIGRIYRDSDSYVVLIQKQYVTSILAAFNDKDSILETWENEKFIIPTKTQKEHRFERKGNLSSLTPSVWCYWFIFKDTNNKLYQRLLDNDNLTIQALEEENRAKEIQNLMQKCPKYTYFGGRKYVLVEDEKPSEETNHNFGRIGDNSDFHASSDLKEESNLKEDDTEFDDSKEIENIGKEEE